MSQTYSTGELAQLAGVSVRTVQYYDKRGILEPSEISEGGRRIYLPKDLERLRVICILRDLDFSVKQIKKVLAEENAGHILSMILEENISNLKEEIAKRKEQLDRSVNLLDTLKKQPSDTLEVVQEVAASVDSPKKEKRLLLGFVCSVLGCVLVHLCLVLAIVSLGSPRLFVLEVPFFVCLCSCVAVYFGRQFQRRIKQGPLDTLKFVSDMSLLMDNQKSWRRLQLKWYASLLGAILVHIALVLGIVYLGSPWLFWLETPCFVILCNWLFLVFRRQYSYLCPNCHQFFEASFKEFAWAGRLARTRKLKCSHCHQKSYCLEFVKEKDS